MPAARGVAAVLLAAAGLLAGTGSRPAHGQVVTIPIPPREAAGAPNGGLPAPVAQALREAGLPPEGVAVEVRPVEGPGLLATVNAETPFNPASTMKLLTSLVALDRFGPAHTWKTRVYATGPIRNGVLRGDLVVEGGGDPHLVLEDLWGMLRRLRQQGLRDVGGDLVLDRSLFTIGDCAPERFDGEPFKPQNVCPDPLLLNFNAVRLDFVPEPERRRVLVRADPQPESLRLANRLRLGGGACPDSIRGLIELEPVEWAHAGPQAAPPAGRLAVGGRYPAACGERSLYVALLSSPRYTAGVFEQLWREAGGRLRGGARDGRVPPGAALLLEHESPPLADLVRVMNKQSNNVMARQIFLLEGGAAGVEQWAGQHGLVLPGLVLENGSGLSRSERITARGLADLLVLAYAGPTMAEFMASLPVLGADGTMKRRYGESALAGRAHIKSGSLNGVRAIAGYVLADSGRRYAVVALVNHERAAAATPFFDALLTWVGRQG